MDSWDTTWNTYRGICVIYLWSDTHVHLPKRTALHGQRFRGPHMIMILLCCKYTYIYIYIFLLLFGMYVCVWMYVCIIAIPKGIQSHCWKPSRKHSWWEWHFWWDKLVAATRFGMAIPGCPCFYWLCVGHAPKSWFRYICIYHIYLSIYIYIYI